ncbi:hypothetical protein [Actinoplanes couchii]|uniref:Uncharacterized protein n=1 Tax=Actinoplanes couchii TaxID=403638 RepID=A0ABQ3XSA6_9ACTN|nr:hypothetical protein [Actinoplanes couchii]MDR6318762.1 hypothetical protein [Actinoplanes couchii]GID61290.1 hypothetical protein Aco03nite_096940 [Actinoplanes couchii]
MTTADRLRISFILGLFALAPLLGTIFNTMVFWENHGTMYHLITLQKVVFFGGDLGISLMIGLDTELDDVPWGKLGLFVLFLALGGLLGWVRYTVEENYGLTGPDPLKHAE